jgi:uncharacterized membrane protein YciS (DUF1049 family)
MANNITMANYSTYAIIFLVGIIVGGMLIISFWNRQMAYHRDYDMVYPPQVYPRVYRPGQSLMTLILVILTAVAIFIIAMAYPRTNTVSQPYDHIEYQNKQERETPAYLLDPEY